MLHFIIISGFQVGVGDDGAILQLTLKPLQRSWAWLVHVVSQHLFWPVKVRVPQVFEGLGAKSINVLKGCSSIWKRGCLEDSGPQHRVGDRRNKWLGSTLKSISGETPHVSTCVPCSTCHHCWIYFQHAECEQVMKSSVTEHTIWAGTSSWSSLQRYWRTGQQHE